MTKNEMVQILKGEFENVTELDNKVLCTDEMLQGDDIVEATLEGSSIWLYNTRTKHTWLYN